MADVDSLITTPPTPALAAAFADAGRSLYVVGGPVRDTLLGRGRDLHDLDFTTDARPNQVKLLLHTAGADSVFAIGEQFGTIGGVFGETIVEITTYRSEQYEPGSRKPTVEFGDSLEGDLSRRDFTINAMAVDARTGALVDPFGGIDDLRCRRIHAVGCAEDRFAEDPLRLLRAVRFAAQIGFEIEDETKRAVEACADTLASISRERVAQEIGRILTSERAGDGIRALCDLALMQHVVPEVLALRGMSQEAAYHHKDVFEHTIQVVDQIRPDLTLRWAALLHDIAKPRTRKVENGEVHFFGHESLGERMSQQILRDLKLDRATIERVAKLVAMHQRANAYDDDWTDGAVRRFIREAGDVLDGLLELSAADVTSRRPDKRRAAAARVEALRDRIERIRAEEAVEKLSSPLDGSELMALFGRGPGPWIRPVKDRLLAAVLDGELAPDDKAGAELLAREVVAAER
jgi:poly(A) polymerase